MSGQTRSPAGERGGAGEVTAMSRVRDNRPLAQPFEDHVRLWLNYLVERRERGEGEASQEMIQWVTSIARKWRKEHYKASEPGSSGSPGGRGR